MIMEQKIKVGIIGVGNMGSGHANNIKNGLCPEIELVAVADINPDRLKWTRENISEDIALFDDAIKMLDSGLIQACIVAVPHYDHPRYVLECAKRGIHVMSEKPAGVYGKQVREMYKELEKYPDVKFGIMFNQRTNDVYIQMRNLIQSGKYGNIRRVNWLITNWYRSQGYYDSGAWRATWSGEGGGVLMNQCPHQLDLIQWICGMPNLVDCHMHFGKWHDIEVEDDVSAYMEYPNGATGVFIATTGDAYGTNRFEVQMDKAKLVVEDNKLRLWEFDMTEQEFSRLSTTNAFAQMHITEVPVETAEPSPEHPKVLNAWVGAILRGTPMVADGIEGINGLTLANAMHMSARLHKPVTLPMDDDAYYVELKKLIATSRRKPETASVYSDTSDSYHGV